MTRRGLVVPQPQKRPRASYRRFSFPRANDCWQLDGTEWALADGTKTHILEVLDDCTRELLASRACVSENAEDAIAVVETAMSWYGIPRMLLSDNGTALNPSRRGWLGRLVAMLVRLGVTPVSSTPKHPRTCGKRGTRQQHPETVATGPATRRHHRRVANPARSVPARL